MNRLASVLVLIYVVCIIIALCTVNGLFGRKSAPAAEGPIIDIKAQNIK